MVEFNALSFSSITGLKEPLYCNYRTFGAHCTSVPVVGTLVQ